jgi:hypothetical protein
MCKDCDDKPTTIEAKIIRDEHDYAKYGCYHENRILISQSPYYFQEEDEVTDYSEGNWGGQPYMNNGLYMKQIFKCLRCLQTVDYYNELR